MQGAHDHFDPDTPMLRLVGVPDDYDALAELFLGGASLGATAPRTPEPEVGPVVEASGRVRPEVVVRCEGVAKLENSKVVTTSEAPTAADEREACIEAMILGHLPVRSMVWIGQYARARAEALCRPVALLRLRSTEASLDLYGLPASSAAPKGALTLEGGVELARAVTNDWIIQVDELSESALAADDRLSAITLLTSANETAVIAAYRAIKGLVSAGPPQPPVAGSSHASGELDSPALRVAVMGASEEEAQAALARLRRACSVFLGRPLELAASVAKVSAARGVNLFRGPACELPAVLESIANPEKTGARSQAGVLAARDAATIAAARTGDVATGRHEAPAQACETLASHIEGLLPLPAHCPDDPAIELAIDPSGRLNVLRRADTPDACQRLVAAVAWARRHAELLALAAAPIGRLDPTLPPLARLFTAEPPALRPLLDTDIRVHLLARSSQGAPWLCAALN